MALNREKLVEYLEKRRSDMRDRYGSSPDLRLDIRATEISVLLTLIENGLFDDA